MPDVKQIETTIRECNEFPTPAPFRNLPLKFIPASDFVYAQIPGLNVLLS
jgi:hypothetical protein